jgi:hypothetical protein
MAKTLSDHFFPVPHVYYTKLHIDPEYIIGYIVMDRIKGRIIGSQKEFEQYFGKIIDVLTDLLEFGILYKDMNINNFILGEDDEIYLIDFEDVVPYDHDYRLIVDHADGISLNSGYIKTALKESIRVRKRHRMGNSGASTPASSPGKTTRSPSRESSPRKTAKLHSPKSSP